MLGCLQENVEEKNEKINLGTNEKSHSGIYCTNIFIWRNVSQLH